MQLCRWTALAVSCLALTHCSQGHAHGRTAVPWSTASLDTNERSASFRYVRGVCDRFGGSHVRRLSSGDLVVTLYLSTNKHCQANVHETLGIVNIAKVRFPQPLDGHKLINGACSLRESRHAVECQALSGRS